MIDTGRLNKRISFVKLIEAKDDCNATILIKNKYKTVWASVEAMPSEETTETGKLSNHITYKIFTRYIKNITPDMIVNYKGKELKINSVLNFREKNELLELTCTEVI